MPTIRRRLLCLLALAGAALAQPSANPPVKSDIEQIVREYILKHPEILVESLQAYQMRERALQQQKAKAAIVARQPELFQDPTSPSTKPAAANPADQVTMVEFFDYRCGFCKKVNGTVLKLAADHPNLRIVYKEFPILGPESVTASKAALAAERQGKYVPFHQALMASTVPITAASIERTAQDIGLDVARMKSDMESPEVAAIIAKNQELATGLDVSSTPTFVIGSEVATGALDAPAFEKLMAKAHAPK